MEINWEAISAIGTWITGFGTILVAILALNYRKLNINNINFEDLANHERVNENIMQDFFYVIPKVHYKIGVFYNISNISIHPIIINSTDLYLWKYSFLKFLPNFILKINHIKNLCLKKININYMYYHFFYDDTLNRININAIPPLKIINLVICIDFEEFKTYKNRINNLIFLINHSNNKKIYKKLEKESVLQLENVINNFEKKCSE